MHITNLRKAGHSVGVALPAALLAPLNLKPGSVVSISVEGDKLVIEPNPKPHYTMAELLAVSDYTQLQPDEERDGVDAPAAGRELM